MWNLIARIILRNKIALIITLVLLTAFMGYKASQIQLSYEFAKVLPTSDPAYIEYEQFTKTFGEDGNVMVIGLQDKNLFTLNKFRDWYRLSNSIQKISGIQNVLGVTQVYNLHRNDSLLQFDLLPVIAHEPQTQAEVDSIKEVIFNLPFYNNLLFNKETGAHLLAITFKKKDLDSKRRITIVEEIKGLCQRYEAAHQTALKYSGMPYIRTAVMKKVSGEMKLFLLLALLITAAILWAFFRSFTSVLFSLLVVAIGVVWSMGTIELFHYKITILTGLIPPLILVIGVPNCIFLINKYQGEYFKHGNKIKALSRTISTIGISLFLANVTTAIGFGVLYFTNSSFLVQFGVIAAINVMITYLITLILIPIILTYLPAPTEKHMRHLEGKRINKLLNIIDIIVHNHRKAVYITIGSVLLVSLYGMTKIDITGYVVDDLPEHDPIYTDLHFFESNFHGVLPFEIVIDTKQANGVFENNAKTLYKIKLLQNKLANYPELSRALSLTEAVKFSYQAYKGGASKYYILPSASELKELSSYSHNVSGSEGKFAGFIDSTKQFTRVSLQMTDIGSAKIKQLLAELKPRVDSIFPKENYTVHFTGHSLMFLKGNDYLLKNLLESLLIEILLIMLVGMALFRSVRIIVLSKIPCLIPLAITAGIMGFLGIRFKPSTILIFSIAFGISSDGTIYFLTKYRQELKTRFKNAEEAISATIFDTGLSMIYTAVILFFGFSIFAASSFGGTKALGILISITLLVAMVTNLILLPSILISIDKWVKRKDITDAGLIDFDSEVVDDNMDFDSDEKAV